MLHTAAIESNAFNRAARVLCGFGAQGEAVPITADLVDARATEGGWRGAFRGPAVTSVVAQRITVGSEQHVAQEDWTDPCCLLCAPLANCLICGLPTGDGNSTVSWAKHAAARKTRAAREARGSAPWRYGALSDFRAAEGVTLGAGFKMRTPFAQKAAM